MTRTAFVEWMARRIAQDGGQGRREACLVDVPEDSGNPATGAGGGDEEFEPPSGRLRG